MNLPLVVDIAIGLVFIYLILSLLTSEVQELIATLLQWRAEHLKNSIENLVTGNNKNNPAQQHFVNELYNSPLIKSLNQEARGLFATALRQITHNIGAIYRTLTGDRNVFGQQKSGPSYIPPTTFSTALLQKIHLHELSQTISELTLRKFRDESLWNLRDILEDLRISLGDDPFIVGNGSLLEKEFYKLEHTLKNSLEDFVSGRASLTESLKLMAEQLALYIDNTDSLLADEHYCKEIIRKRLAYLKQSIARQRLEPTITEVLRLLLTEIEGQGGQPTQQSQWASEIIDQLNKQNPDLLQQVTNLPPHLGNSLLSLAKRARTKSKTLEEEVRQLEQEVADWFNHSMERASGVYRRNAKGIAILIGFLVAVVINADTLHMIDRLSKDNLIRSTITQTADQVIIQRNNNIDNPNTLRTDLEGVKNAVNETLDELPLPIGWHDTNLTEQAAASQGRGFPLLRRILGWAITGIALSMGATFWFDLLNQVMRARSTGNKPKDED